MSPFAQARAIFKAIRCDPAAIAAQRAAYATLAASITSPTGGMQLTSGTENGQSFTATYATGSSASERLAVLEILIGMLDRGAAGSKTTLRRFL